MIPRLTCAALALLAVLAARPAAAVTLSHDLPAVGTTMATHSFNTGGLNGTPLNGQSLYVQFDFPDDKALRLLTSGKVFFDVDLTLQLDGDVLSTTPMDLVPFPTGQANDHHGDPLLLTNPIHASKYISVPTDEIGYGVRFLSVGHGGNLPTDIVINGLGLNLQLPTLPMAISGARLDLSFSPLTNNEGLPLGTGLMEVVSFQAPIDGAVPEPATAALGLLSLAALSGALRRRR